jgi:hypothetical protein
MRTHTQILAMIATAGLALSGCGEKKEEETSEESTTGTPASGGGGGGTSTDKVAAADDVSDLQLTAAFALKLPAALSGEEAGASLLQAGAKKSQEACQIGQTVRESVRSIESIGNFFCHLEVEKDKIVFGKKFLINTNGVEFAKIFVDNSQAAAGKITIGFCSKHGSDESNKELIVIDGLTDAGPKGASYNMGTSVYEDKEQSWQQETAFDMSSAGLMNLITSQLHTHDGNTFRRKVELAITEAGLTTAKLAARGSWQGNAFTERGAAMFNGSFGSAIYQNAGSHQGQEFSFSRRAYFSEAGDVLTAADLPSSVIPQVTDVPAFLADDFSPSMPEGWVQQGCPDYDDVVDLDPESAAHQACDNNQDDQRDCWDQEKFQQGSENVTIE